MNIKKYLLISMIVLCPLAVFPQEAVPEQGVMQDGSAAPAAGLPSGFMNITLGLTMEELENALYDNSYFDYRGKPDVDMRISEERSLIECSGFSYVKKGYFQFYNKKLIIITVIIDENELDFYSFYTKLEKKYGKADRLNPDGVYWENSDLIMSLEKPLSVKYTDKKSFSEIKEKFAEKTTSRKKLKEDFVDTF